MRRRFCNIIFSHSVTLIAFFFTATNIKVIVFDMFDHIFFTAFSCFHIPVTVYFFFHGFIFRENLNRLFWKWQFRNCLKHQHLHYSSLLQRVYFKVVNAWSTLWLSRRRKNVFQGSLNNINVPVSLPQQSVEACLYLVHFPTFRHSTKEN